MVPKAWDGLTKMGIRAWFMQFSNRCDGLCYSLCTESVTFGIFSSSFHRKHCSYESIYGSLGNGEGGVNYCCRCSKVGRVMRFYVGNLLLGSLSNHCSMTLYFLCCIKKEPLWLARAVRSLISFTQAPCLSNGRITDLEPI